MAEVIEEKEINRLIRELCAARADDAAAIGEAHELVTTASRPYSAEKLKAFCEAGEKMLRAHNRKMNAWNQIRDAVSRPEDSLDDSGNHARSPVRSA